MSQVKVSGNASGTGVFEIAAPNSNSNYTLTLPTATTTLVGTDATQTLTNKTLTSPTLTTPNIDSATFATVEGTAPLYGCRAWVNFDGVTAGTFAGGASTVTRIAGSTTATVTTTTAHGMITGNVVYAATGVVAGAYTITVLSSTTFSFTTVATTALTAASITFTVVTIRAAGNVNSVAKTATGVYAINFTTAMPDANFAPQLSIDSGIRHSITSQTSTSMTANTFNTAGTAADITGVYLAVFR